MRVADLFELGQRLPPGVVRRAGVSGGVVDVAEMGEVSAALRRRPSSRAMRSAVSKQLTAC